MITLGDLILRFVIVLVIIFFSGFVLDICSVFKRIVGRKLQNKKDCRHISSSGATNTTETYVNNLDGKDDVTETNSYFVYRVNLQNGRYRVIN